MPKRKPEFHKSSSSLASKRFKPVQPSSSAPDQCHLPPSPDLVHLVNFELPSKLTAENAAYNEGETPASASPHSHADLSVYGEGVPEQLRLEYEGDVRGKGSAQLYYDPTSDYIPLEKKLVQKAKRRFKQCRKIMEKAEVAELADVNIAEDTVFPPPAIKVFGATKQRASQLAFNWSMGSKNASRPTLFKDRKGRRAVIYVPHDSSRDHHLESLKNEIKSLEESIPPCSTERGDFGVIQLQLHRDLGAKEPVYSQTYTKYKDATDSFLKSDPVEFYSHHIAGMSLCEPNQAGRF
ncbi:hypothetical protein FRC04_007206 [Tulasnella sp. 424]|nr:hypothetical protein FRC04_007206 [Tulasnella sp. 424]